MRFSENEPDYDRYEPKPVEDIDMPDFDAPDQAYYLPNGLPVRVEFVTNPEARDITKSISGAVDPAEHAAHALIDALGTLDQEIAKTTDLERANRLRKMLKRAWADVTRVTDNAGDKVDQIVERLR